MQYLLCGYVPKIVNLIKLYKKKTNFKVRYQLSEICEVKLGLRQEYALSLTILFNIVLEWVVRTIKETRKMKIGKIEVIWAYADDAVVLENSKNEVTQTTMKCLEAGEIWD